jgi:hypothetical protein
MMRNTTLVTYQRDVENNTTKRRDSGQYDGCRTFPDIQVYIESQGENKKEFDSEIL